MRLAAILRRVTIGDANFTVSGNSPLIQSCERLLNGIPMRLLCHLHKAALLLCLLFAQQAFGQIERITFDTTGDFGIDANWSDPAKAPPEKPPGATFDHNFYFYYINDNNTATISAGSPNGSHFEVLHMFVGDSPPGVAHTPGTLIMEGGPAPGPGLFGASLEVPNIHEFRLGQNCNLGGLGPCTGGGTVIMNGASDLLAPGLIVGERAKGELFIGPDARVRSLEPVGVGTFARRDIRIGTYGPERGLGVNTIDGNGLIEVEGELLGNTLYMPESDADGVLRVMPGGVVNLRGVDMTFESHRPNRSALLEIIGSGGSFTTTVGSFFVSHPTATLKFVADAGGVTPIVSVGIANPPTAAGGGDVEGGNLVLDLDDFNFTPSSTLMLLDLRARDTMGNDYLFGTFGSVTFLGDTTATVNYDYVNGDIFLNNFMSTEPPGIVGDYNDNGVVDGADYVVYRNSLGQAVTLPNDDTPGSVLPVDYDRWRTNFGLSSGAGAAVSIPEPTTMASAALLAALSVSTRRLRREKE
jgi:hypothetical protein